MDKRVTPPKPVTSRTWGPPPPCKQALSNLEPELLDGEGEWVAKRLRVGQSEVNGTMRASVSCYIYSFAYH